MRSIIGRMMSAAKHYTVWDFGFLKMALFSAGIIIGAYYAPFFLNYMPLLWIVAIVSFVWIAYHTFFKYTR